MIIPSMSESKSSRKRTPSNKPFFQASKSVKAWGSLESKSIPSSKKETIVDQILRDLDKKGVQAYEYNLNPNGYTGIVKASRAEKPRIEIKVLGAEGEGADRTYQVAIRKKA
jgi:hypothetical protein